MESSGRSGTRGRRARSGLGPDPLAPLWEVRNAGGVRADGHEALLGLVYCTGSSSLRTGQWYAERGMPIPERLLPGRLMAVLGAPVREALAATDWSNAGTWWVRLLVSTAPSP